MDEVTTAITFLLGAIECDFRDKFKCKCSMRQGDLLSPLLFMLAAQLLQSVLNKAWHEGYLDLPINQPAFGDYLVIQYADDAILTYQLNILSS